MASATTNHEGGASSRVFAGWLRKRGPTPVFDWRSTWCLLTEKSLEVFVDDTCKDMSLRIEVFPTLRAVSFDDPGAPGDASVHRPHVRNGFVVDTDPFKVRQRRAFHYFEADSSEAVQMWIRSLNRAALSTLQKQGPEDKIVPFTLADLPVNGKVPKHCMALAAVCTARCFVAEGDYFPAEHMYRTALVGIDEVVGPDHPLTLISSRGAARCLFEQGRLAEAESFYRRALRGHERVFGTEDTSTASCLAELAECLSNQGRYSDAEALHSQIVQRHDTALGKEHPETLRSVGRLVECLSRQSKDWEAEPLKRRLLAARGGLSDQAARESFRGQLSAGHGGQCEKERFVVVSDVGQDNDDEMALLLLGELELREEIKLLALVANLRPADKRAALARGTLDMLGLHDVPVGIGTDGGPMIHSDTFSEHVSVGKTGVDYLREPMEAVARVRAAIGTDGEVAVSEAHRIFEGQRLLCKVLERQPDKSVSLLLISSLSDAAKLLRENEELFVSRVKSVTIMGGMQMPFNHVSRIKNEERLTMVMPDDNQSEPVLMEPSDAHNNMFDFKAAQFFYRRCQELGVQLVVVSRFAAYDCAMPKQVYDLMVRCPAPNPVVCRLQRAQRTSIENLWKDVCTGGKLPPRCDKRWFCDTFCGGQGLGRADSDSMWDLVSTFNMYDPLAVVAAIAPRREMFFVPDEHTGPKGTVHLHIGTARDRTNMRPERIEDLKDFLMTAWIHIAGRLVGDGFGARPAELDAEVMTSALGPKPSHSKEEMAVLNTNVLRLLDTEWPGLKNSSLLGTWRDRDQHMRSIGPAMLLLDYQTILRLGRIPHSFENKSLTMEEAARIAKMEGRRFFIEMFSHRWHTPYAPDDQKNNKARVLVEWAKYRLSMGLRTFYWVDYVCINQNDIAPGVSMLPLYVSCCNNILCYDTEAYERRAWCRVERLMFAAFVAPNVEFVDPDFIFRPSCERTPGGEMKPATEGPALVPDPTAEDALLSYASDSKLIKTIKYLCHMHWGKCWKEGLMEAVETKAGLNVRRLKYGVTTVRTRKFT